MGVSCGDYFLLVSLAKNLDALAFKDVIEQLIKKKRAADPNSALAKENATMFSPHAPSYRHFNMEEEEDPTDFKRRMAAESSAPDVYPNLDTRV